MTVWSSTAGELQASLRPGRRTNKGQVGEIVCLSGIAVEVTGQAVLVIVHLDA